MSLNTLSFSDPHPDLSTYFLNHLRFPVSLLTSSIVWGNFSSTFQSEEWSRNTKGVSTLLVFSIFLSLTPLPLLPPFFFCFNNNRLTVYVMYCQKVVWRGVPGSPRIALNPRFFKVDPSGIWGSLSSRTLGKGRPPLLQYFETVIVVVKS